MQEALCTHGLIITYHSIGKLGLVKTIKTFRFMYGAYEACFRHAASPKNYQYKQQQRRLASASSHIAALFWCHSIIPYKQPNVDVYFPCSRQLGRMGLVVFYASRYLLQVKTRADSSSLLSWSDMGTTGVARQAQLSLSQSVFRFDKLSPVAAKLHRLSSGTFATRRLLWRPAQ